MSNSNGRNRITVNGFVFENLAEAEQAKKEAEGVTYIRAKLNMDEPESVLEIYNKMVQQELFETAVGYAYLSDLQNYLLSIPFIEKENILPIQVLHPALEESLQRRAKMTASAKEPEVLNVDFKKRFQIASFICGILVVCVVAMFIIMGTTNNATVLNYENELINRYEAWEQELLEREAAVSEKEEELGIGEN